MKVFICKTQKEAIQHSTDSDKIIIESLVSLYNLTAVIKDSNLSGTIRS